MNTRGNHSNTQVVVSVAESLLESGISSTSLMTLSNVGPADGHRHTHLTKKIKDINK